MKSLPVIVPSTNWTQGRIATVATFEGITCGPSATFTRTSLTRIAAFRDPHYEGEAAGAGEDIRHIEELIDLFLGFDHFASLLEG